MGKEDLIGLTDEEADKALAEALAAETTEESASDTEQGDTEEKVEGDEKKEADDRTEEEKADDEEAGDSEDKDDKGKEGEEKITHDPLKDTKARLTKREQENADLRRENAKLRQTRLIAEEPKAPATLTPEELKALREADPEKAADYIVAVKMHERDKADWDARKTTVQQQEQNEAIIRSQTSMATSFLSAAHELLGLETDQVDIEGMLDGTIDRPKEVSELLASREFAAVVKELDANPQVYRDRDGNLSPRMVRMIYKDLHGEKLEKAAKLKGAKESLTRRSAASNGGSFLDKGGTKSETGKSGFVKIEDLSQADILAMDEKSLDALAEKEGLQF